MDKVFVNGTTQQHQLLTFLYVATYCYTHWRVKRSTPWTPAGFACLLQRSLNNAIIQRWLIDEWSAGQGTKVKFFVITHLKHHQLYHAMTNGNTRNTLHKAFRYGIPNTVLDVRRCQTTDRYKATGMVEMEVEA